MSDRRRPLWLGLAVLLVLGRADGQIVRASGFHGLTAMEQACAAVPAGRCALVVSTLQTITLKQPHTLPAGIQLQFADGGGWIVNGAALTISSGVVEGPASRQIFAGTSEIKGLKNARPEWFVAEANGVYPARALAAAYRATVPWGTVLLNDATYVSPFFDATKPDGCGGAMAPYTTPRRLLGAERPHVDDERAPTRLVGGTVIQGEICGSAPLQAAHLGVDAGPFVVQSLYGGVKSNGIYLPNHGELNPRRGTHLVDVSVLTNDLDTEHSVLIEGEEEALIEGLWIWTPGGTHGLILKSAHSVVRDFHCKGASADCLLIKSDYRTAANGRATDDVLDGIDIRYLKKPGDTGGVEMDARWDSVSRIVFRNVLEDGTSFGFNGAGSWFYTLKGVAIDGWTARDVTGPCTVFLHSTDIMLRRASCNGRGDLSVSAPKTSWLAELKPQLRILWTTLVTWLGVAWRRVLSWF